MFGLARRRRRPGGRLDLTVTLVAALLLTGCSGAHEAATPSTTTPSSTVPSNAVAARTPPLPATANVRVAVATLWKATTSPRPVDAAALSNPVDIRRWLSTMTLAQKEDLVGRIDSQMLLGDSVVVDSTKDEWAHVTVPGQRNLQDARGYPGWVPLAQLTFDAPASTGTDATVIARTAWLTDPDDGHRVLEVSMGTRLPVRVAAGSVVVVSTPEGGTVDAAASDVAVTKAGAPAITPSAASVVRTARMFEGLPYLWAGTSGFGFDCSGLTYLVYRMYGVALSRDADAQVTEGAAVAPGGLRPGDLLFYAKRGAPPHHVSMDVDGSHMVQSPQTGKTVEVVPIDSSPYAKQFIGARRYIA